MKPTQIPAIVNAASGAIGGVIANATLFPLDVVTVRLQIQKGEFDGLLDAFRKILHEEGPAALYEGILGDSTATLVQAFLYFFSYDWIRNTRLHRQQRLTGKLPRTLSTAEELAVGSIAGIFCKLFTSPINNYVVLKQAESELVDADASPLQALRQIYDAKGILGFWSGYKATILLSVNPSLTYYFFQYLSSRIIPRHRAHRPRSYELFIAAALAKSLATLITYPAILVKTRTQVASRGEHVLQILWSLVRKNGFRSLYAGASGQILKGFFSQGITMMTKDRIARAFVRVYLSCDHKIK